MTHTEASHNIVFSFNQLLDALPATASQQDAAALASLFASAAVTAGNNEAAGAFHELVAKLQRAAQRKAAPQPPAQQPPVLNAKAVRPAAAPVPQPAAVTVSAKPAEPTATTPLIDTILAAMRPQLEAEALKRIAARQAAQQ